MWPFNRKEEEDGEGEGEEEEEEEGGEEAEAAAQHQDYLRRAILRLRYTVICFRE